MMASSKKSLPPSKTYWCKGALGLEYVKMGLPIQNVRPCRYGTHECYNAHDQKEIKEDTYISNWASRNKSDFNLGAVEKELRSVIGSERDSIKNPEYISSSRKMETLRFDELLFLWWDLACYHRRVAKDLRRTSHVEGYSSVKIVPKFYLSNEEAIWALVRTLRVCDKYKFLVENPRAPIDIKDICVGHINCKHGVHQNSLLVCIDDMLFGTCDCKSAEEIEIVKEQNTAEIERLQVVMHDLTGSEKFKIFKQIRDLKEQNKTLFRKVHYTEQGMVPLSVHKEAEKAKAPKKITTESVEGKSVRKIGKKKK